MSGYLAPLAPLPFTAGSLDAAIQLLIVGMTGLDPSLVRARWQPIPPQQPLATVDWCSFGARGQTPDAGPSVVHNASGAGQDKMQRHETIAWLASFYGPNSRTNAELLRDGFGIWQNRQALQADGMAFVDTSDLTRVPAKVNQQFVSRDDIIFTIRRQIRRSYPVPTIVVASTAVST